MFASRSTVTLHRAPNYYSKNIFPPVIHESVTKDRSDEHFWLEGTPYLAEENVGAGAFGIVCKATDMRFEKQVAIKKVHRVLKSQSSAKCALREIRILRKLSHDNIINVMDIFMVENANGKDIYLVMDLMETDLHCVLQSNQKLHEDHYRYFFYQLLRGLKYLHSAGIIHRDLKPSNLLMNGDCQLRIADFGMSRSGPSSQISTPNNDSNVSRNLSQYVSTLWYRAPEILLTMGEYDTKVDIWSAGCILAEMLLRREIFPGQDSYSQIKMIINYLGTPEKKAIKKVRSPMIRDYIVACGQKSSLPYSVIFPNASSEARYIISYLLQISPWKRSSAEEILEHPFLTRWHNVQNEPNCSEQIRQDLREIEKFEGDVIIKGLDEEAKFFEKLRGTNYNNKVTNKKSIKKVFDKLLLRKESG